MNYILIKEGPMFSNLLRHMSICAVIAWVCTSVILALPGLQAQEELYSVTKIPNPASAVSTRFGHTLALDQRVLAVGAPNENDGRGAVYIYERRVNAVTPWVIEKRLTYSDTGIAVDYGGSLALEGDVLIVKSRDDVSLENLVSIHHRDMGGDRQWGHVRTHRLPSSGGRNSLALCDGILIVGTPGSEAAHVFQRNSGGPNAWDLVTVLEPLDGPSEDLFGFSTACSGSTVAVGRPADGDLFTGSVYLFELSPNDPADWVEQAKFSGSSPGFFFGGELDIDDNTLIVASSPSATTPPPAVFRRDASGADWQLVDFLDDPQAPGGTFSTLLINENQILAFADSESSGPYRFERTSTSSDDWSYLDQLLVSDAAAVSPGFSMDQQGGFTVLGDPDNVEAGMTRGAVYIVSSRRGLSVFDVNPTYVDKTGIFLDPARLVEDGELRSGIAADGVSQLLLRYGASGAGTVRFSVNGPSLAEDDGGVDAVGEGTRQREVTVPVVEVDGSHYAFAVYRAPDEFDPAGQTLSRSRFITLEAQYTPIGNGEAEIDTFQLELHRTPLLFLHGLWSSGNTWDFSAVRDSRFIYRHTPSYSNALSLEENVGVVGCEIATVMSDLRTQGVAASKVDIIGHSMGGLLARLWALEADNFTVDNYQDGYIRKLITLDTPHCGSRLASLFVENLSDALADAFGTFGFPLTDGAVGDLAFGSTAIAALPAANVPTHAIVGVGGVEFLPDTPGFWGVVFNVIEWFFSNTLGSILFDGMQHDSVVAEDSQRGGLSGFASTLIGGMDGVHTNNTSSPVYSDQLLYLLHEPVANPVFEPLPSTAAVCPAPRQLEHDIRIADGVGDIEITVPTDGHVVTPGELITVQVDTVGVPLVDSVLVVGPGVAVRDDKAPFSIEFQIPSDASGVYALQAFGKGSGQEIYRSGVIDLDIMQTAALVSLEAVPEDPIIFGVDRTFALQILGTFDDGAVRDLTSPIVGTRYSVVEQVVASVSSDGTLRSRSFGETPIIIENGGVRTTAWLTVTEEPASPVFSDNFESGTTDEWDRRIGN